MNNVMCGLVVSFCILTISDTYVKASMAPSSSSSSSSSSSGKEMRKMLTGPDGSSYSKIIVRRELLDKELKGKNLSVHTDADISVSRGLCACSVELPENVDTGVLNNEFEECLIIDLRVLLAEHGGLLSKTKVKRCPVRATAALADKTTNGKPLYITLKYSAGGDIFARTGTV